MCHPKNLMQLSLVSSVVLFTLNTIVSAEFSLTPTKQENRTCRTNNNEDGICINAKYCTKNFTISIYGLPADSELREKNPNQSLCVAGEWCCAFIQNYNDSSEEETDDPPAKNETKEPSPAPSGECTVLDSTDCPWCVTLHKGKLNDHAATGLFCMGTMVGPKIVLTSATCLLATRNIEMWVQVPTAPKPRQKYRVRYTKRHADYNSGTHEFDYGLAILEDKVDWGQKKWSGACLGLQKTVTGDCTGFGFDANDKIVSTFLTSSPGGCTESGNTTDVACSRKFVREDYCIIAPGSPVSCSDGDVNGVARSVCYGDEALVGTLTFAKDWIKNELKSLNLSPSEYSINRS